MCNLSIYQRVLADLDATRSNEIHQLLDELQGRNNQFRCIIRGIRAENILPPECMQQILEFMLKNVSVDTSTSTILANYKQICRRYKLRGERIDSSGIRYYGTAVYKDKFIARVEDANSSVVNSLRTIVSFRSGELRQLLESYVNEDADIAAQSELDGFNDYLMNDPAYSTWATWDTDDEDPFSFMKTRDIRAVPPSRGCACELRLSLALCYDGSPTIETNNMWLLTYHASQIEAHIPTIADAEGYQYFSPCPDGNNYGLTDPAHQDLRDYYINRCLTHNNYLQYNDRPRPEAVHTPITIGSLTKIEELEIPATQ
jgi:hypothetical protein